MVRAGIGGILATAVDFSVMVILRECAGLAVGYAAFLGALCGGIVSYLISKLWAFGDATPVGARQVSAYALVSIATAFIVAPLVHELDALGLDYRLAKVIAAVAVFVCWGYPAQSRLVFRNVHRVGTTTPGSRLTPVS